MKNAFINYFMEVQHMEDLRRIRNEVKELRYALGLTQKSFAFKLGVSVSAVKQWESGRCYPSAPHMKLISDLKNNELSPIIEKAESKLIKEKLK